MRQLLTRALFSGLFSALVITTGAAGQDIELLGKHHGTRPPQGYYDRMAEDPGAYQFQRALIRRGLGLKEMPRIDAQGRGVDLAFSQAMAGSWTVRMRWPSLHPRFGRSATLSPASDTLRR